jgi:hypothetical protein
MKAQAGLGVQTSAVLHRCTLVQARGNSIGYLQNVGIVILYFYFSFGLHFRTNNNSLLHKGLWKT